MTATLEIGDERYTIEQGEITPDDPEDIVAVARAKVLNTMGPAWYDEAQRETFSFYDPDPDCTLATVISRHLQGRARCGPPAPAPPPGVQY